MRETVADDGVAIVELMQNGQSSCVREVDLANLESPLRLETRLLRPLRHPDSSPSPRTIRPWPDYFRR